MHEYRLKQPKNRLDCLESVFFSVFGLGLILMERRIALGLTLFAFAAWSLWRDFYKRSREIVFSEEGICKISREGMQTLPLEDFCGVAVFTDTKRSRIINIYRIALVPKQPYDTPLTVYTAVQSFTRLPALPPDSVNYIRHRITECTGLQDFGDIGSSTLSELYAKCCFLNQD